MDVVTQYFENISSYCLLQQDEINALFEKYRNGTPEESKESKERLICHNLRLVVWQAKKMSGLAPLEDLIQSGNIGLMKAIENFDEKRGSKFSTYAVWLIRQQMERDICNHYFAGIRQPVHVVEDSYKIQQAISHYRNENHSEPTVKELSERIGISEMRIKRVLALPKISDSLDEDVSQDGSRGTTLGELIQDNNQSVETNLFNEDRKRLIKDALLNLSDFERSVIEMRFGMGEDGKCWTLQDIGNLYHLSRERIRQVETKAIRKLRSPKIKKRLREFLEN